jgi:hypothetical protein
LIEETINDNQMASKNYDLRTIFFLAVIRSFCQIGKRNDSQQCLAVPGGIHISHKK